MTLDEWKAIQSKDRAKVEFNIRKPNEGADGQWKKGFVLHKSKSEEVNVTFHAWSVHFVKVLLLVSVFFRMKAPFWEVLTCCWKFRKWEEHFFQFELHLCSFEQHSFSKIELLQ